MKAWTLFLVILFSDIYEQRHISAYYFTDNRSLHWHAKSIVRDVHDITRTVLKIVKKKYSVFKLSENKFYCEATLYVSTLAVKTTFNTIKITQKLIIITTQQETEISVKQTNENTNLLNNSELGSPNFKRMLRECV